jgi:hypothetical protein
VIDSDNLDLGCTRTDLVTLAHSAYRDPEASEAGAENARHVISLHSYPPMKLVSMRSVKSSNMTRSGATVRTDDDCVAARSPLRLLVIALGCR